MTITVGGSNITFPDATTQTTAALTSAVTSAVAGNGVAVSAATGAVTFSASCPTANSIGSYALVGYLNNSIGFTFGSNYAAGIGNQQLQAAYIGNACPNTSMFIISNLSGTWKWLGGTFSTGTPYFVAIGCRVA